MPYVNGDGTVNQTRSVFRWSIFSDIFWTVVNTVALFVNTLVNPAAPLPSSRDATRYNRLHNTSLSSSSSTTSSSSGKGNGSRGERGPRPFGAKIAQIPKSCNTGK